jgi:hypothetical protein
MLKEIVACLLVVGIDTFLCVAEGQHMAIAKNETTSNGTNCECPQGPAGPAGEKGDTGLH